MGSANSSPIGRRPEDGGRPQSKSEVASSKAEEVPVDSGSIRYVYQNPKTGIKHFIAAEDVDWDENYWTIRNGVHILLDQPSSRLPPKFEKPKVVTASYAPTPTIVKEWKPTTFESWNKLAPEIRVMVLETYLAMPEPIRFASKTKAIAKFRYDPLDSGGREDFNVWARRISKQRIGQLSLISKVMYAEAIPAFFGINTFSFNSTNVFVSFASRLCPKYRWHVRKISISWVDTAKVDAAKALRTFVGLRELKLDQVGLHRFKSGKKQVDTSGMVVQVKLKAYAQKELLCLRGLTKVEIGFNDHVLGDGYKRPCTQADKDAFMQDLQILKSRQDEKLVQKQRAKDFPVS